MRSGCALPSMTWRYAGSSPTFSKPWTLAIPYVTTGKDMFEYACHEGNYGMEGILSGARQEEKEKAKP